MDAINQQYYNKAIKEAVERIVEEDKKEIIKNMKKRLGKLKRKSGRLV